MPVKPVRRLGTPLQLQGVLCVKFIHVFFFVIPARRAAPLHDSPPVAAEAAVAWDASGGREGTTAEAQKVPSADPSQGPARSVRRVKQVRAGRQTLKNVMF